MRAVLFWHGQFVGVSTNSFKYWRGWVSEVGGVWHFYYQFGRMAGCGKAGSSRVSYKRAKGRSFAELLLRDKVDSKRGKGYSGKWYYPCDLSGFDFPLDVAPLDWQLPVTQVKQMKVVVRPKQKPTAAVQSDDAPAKHRSPLSIGWRLDLP